jgi:uncharacterized protein (DUF2461 family)
MDLLWEVNKLSNKFDMQLKEALFRISGDMSFSKYQYPYKTLMVAGFSKGDRKLRYLPKSD